MTPKPEVRSPEPRSPWLVSRRFDLAVFVLPALASLLLAAISGRLAEPDGQTPTWAWLAFVVGIDVAHVHGTTLRVYLDPRERARRRDLYLLVPVLSFFVAAAAYALSPLAFWRALAYLAVFHFVRQQIGWLRLYRKRAGERAEDARFDEAVLYAATLYPLVVWHARGSAEIAWFVPGDFFAGMPQLLAELAFWPWITLLGAFALRHVRGWHAHAPMPWGKLWLVATTAATWWLGIVFYANDFAFTVTNVIAHGIPYMAMSQRVGSAQSGARAPYKSFATYAAVLCALALLEEYLWDVSVWHEHAALFGVAWFDATPVLRIIVPLLALPQITHYVLDAYLWRLDGSNPGLAEALGVA